MTPDIADICDEVWHGTNGDDLLVMSGCPGCHYVAGAAAVLGIIEMAKMLAARERAKPFSAEDAEGLMGCNRRHPASATVRCNLVNDHEGPHKKIGRTGNVNYTWPNVERAAADRTRPTSARISDGSKDST